MNKLILTPDIIPQSTLINVSVKIYTRYPNPIQFTQKKRAADRYLL